ncbi:fumarylacetoacetate hydrolase family protein [Emcibacter sp.]|uniref:fumarylacetoacetate hydrolase family protein n=1 Tax=Emcibacter sp. TaxID=1979954 RepID=UPI002AA81E6A|nr:fumarylacetoacetate hydrolase family protein [Emcibacter sp.]
MVEYIFTPPDIFSLPIRGQSQRYPVKRIFCVGRNYAAHAREMGFEVDKSNPFFFTKSAFNAAPSGCTVSYPPETEDYHHEMEMVVLMGGPAFRITAEEALGQVYGYACGLDMTRRDVQAECRRQSRPWSLAKDVEQSAIIAEAVPAAECGHPASGRIELSVNGEARQSSDISHMVNNVAELISFLSRYYHLDAGDVIFTGTPDGVGPVRPGDHLEGTIEGVGSISLTVRE